MLWMNSSSVHIAGDCMIVCCGDMDDAVGVVIGVRFGMKV